MTAAGRAFGLAWIAALPLAGSPRAAAQVLPPSVLPGLGPGAARVPVSVDRMPWRAVVRVQTELGGRCTGALVGPRLVLTAAHCLLGRGTGRPVRPGSVHVLTGYARGEFEGHARAVASAAGSGDAGSGDDWALLTLDAPLGTPDRVLPLLREAPPPGTPLMLGGYEQDRSHAMVADLACASGGLVRDGAGRVLLRHSCAATRGASGAPVLARAPDGGWGIAGVTSRAEAGVSAGATARGGYAVPAAAIDPALLAGTR